MPIHSAADLVAALAAHRILAPAQQESVTAGLAGRSLDARGLARELMTLGWLSPYQANLLLQDRGAELVLGPYLLVARLGEGGMGQVFEARHQIMDRVVALKVVRKDRLSCADAVQRFQREVRLVAQLDHPNLVRAHDAAQVGDTHFLVMEYIEGCDLHRLVQKSGPLPVAQACIYIRQAALGLQHAHERGMVHRDIKPSNLQVEARGQVVKVLDLGLARSQVAGVEAGRPELTRPHTVLGTPDYIAPEQIDDPSRVDIRADVYSLGCTLYFALVGHPPFPSGNWEEKLACHRRVEPRPIEQVRPDVPLALASVLRTMMAKRPADRFAVPNAVADALVPFCALPVAIPALATTVARPLAGATPLHGHAPRVPTGPLAGPSPETMPAHSTFDVQPGTPPPAPPSGQPRAGGRKRWKLALAGVGGLGVVVVLLVLLWPKGGPDKKDDTVGGKAVAPVVVEGKDKPRGPFIDEDFVKAQANKQVLPDGWKSDGDPFRIIKDNFGPCLEISKPGAEYHRVKLPPVPLRGNFTIEGTYVLDAYQKFGVHLEDRKTNAVLLVGTTWDGKVNIGDDVRAAPPTYKPYLSTRFVIRRKGTRLKVELNDEIAVEKDLGKAIEYGSVEIGLTGATGAQLYRTARLYRLKIAPLPE